MKILLTGASGYLGGRLAPLLLEDGHQLRCLVRNRRTLRPQPWHRHERVEIVEGDALDPVSLRGLFEGCDVLYYLIHSMLASERGFEARDRQAARAVAVEAAAAGVRHIVYLGGLGDPGDDRLSHHLRSRHETGRELATAGVPLTEFRAAIIVGSGSLSFEMIRYLTERLPLMVTPSWTATRVQPIAVRDVLAYLRRAPEHPPRGHAIVEIGGPDVLTYRRLMEIYAEVRGLWRLMLPVPILSPRLSSYWVNLVTPIPGSIARPLVEGLSSEVVVRDPDPAAVYGVTPIPFRRAVELALDRTRQGAVDTLWSDSAWEPAGLRGAGARLDDEEGMLIDRRVGRFRADAQTLYRAVARLGGDDGWYAFDWLWQLRGLLDRVMGGIGLRRGRRDPEQLVVGDVVDFWRVESVAPGRHLQLRAEMKLPGRAWLRFDIEPNSAETELRQTAFFEPRGLLGLLYWWAVFPLHLLLFPKMLARIGQRAEAEARMRSDAAAGAG